MCVYTYQVADMDNVRQLATRRRGLFGCADRVVDGDTHACLLLANGTPNQCVTGSDFKAGNKKRERGEWDYTKNKLQFPWNSMSDFSISNLHFTLLHRKFEFALFVILTCLHINVSPRGWWLRLHGNLNGAFHFFFLAKSILPFTSFFLILMFTSFRFFLSILLCVRGHNLFSNRYFTKTLFQHMQTFRKTSLLPVQE